MHSQDASAFYYRWQGEDLCSSESTLLLPAEPVLKTVQDIEEPHAFEEKKARAKRMDVLRANDRLNLHSPWVKATDGEGDYYWKKS
eukprot:COSAG02_NODE_27009_length_617_cov_0.680769_1_plen_86_part_00